MKIVHIITRLIIGGAQENTLLSCEGQHDRGHEVTLITGPGIGPEGSLMDRARGYGYRVIEVDAMRRSIHAVRDWRTYSELVRLLKELKPDLVHTHSSKAGILGRWAARRARVPAIVHTIHGLAFTASTSRVANAVYRYLEKITAPLTTRIVCVADAMARQSLEAGIGRPEQYVTVYSGMETAAFINPPVPREEMRRRLGVKQSDVVVGTIARLFDLKGHEDLLELAPQLCSHYPNVRFLWVGDGSLRSLYERSIARMGLQNRFILTGLVPPEEIPNYTGAMDILAHPSRREGLARALPQGSLAGCPVICYDIDGNAEALVHEKTGFVIPPFDVEQFGRALSVLLPNAALRAEMGAAGRDFALQRFDTRVMVDSLECVYAEAVRCGMLHHPPSKSQSEKA